MSRSQPDSVWGLDATATRIWLSTGRGRDKRLVEILGDQIEHGIHSVRFSIGHESRAYPVR